MLIVTDKSAVDAVFSSKTPRPWREVVLEIYPDATEDCNGRFHAPYDGYECNLTGKTFRGGEYLPIDTPDDNYRMMGGSTPNFPKAQDPTTKELFEWNGTRAQNIAVWGMLIEQTREYDKIKSYHVGEVGKKLGPREVSIVFIKGFSGFYGITYITVMKDLEGCVFVYKGSKKLGEKGAKFMLDGKIKAHSVREGIAQTIIERPKVTLIKSEPIVETASSRREKFVTNLLKSGLNGDEMAYLLKEFDLRMIPA